MSGLTETLTAAPAAAAPSDDPNRYAVPSRWPSPTFPQALAGFAKLGIFVLAWLFAGTALRHGADANVAILFLGVVTTVLVLAIRD